MPGHTLTATALALMVLTVRGAAEDPPLRIVPDPVTCVQAGRFPVLRVRMEPAATLEKARLRFRPTTYPLWYEVPVQSSTQGRYAVLPKPRLSAQRIHYYFEVISDGRQTRTPERVVTVVERLLECPGSVASVLTSARVPIEVPLGAPSVPPVPPGFSPVGAVAEGEVRRGAGRAPLLIAGGVGAIVAAGTALTGGPPPSGPSSTARPELVLLDTTPPARSTISLSSGPFFSVKLRIRPGRAVGPGRITLVLFRFAQTGRPCALLAAAHEGLAADGQEVLLGGPFLDARICQTDRMRVSVEEAGREMMSTGHDGLLDFIITYFLVE